MSGGAEYMREYRANNKEYREKNDLLSKARRQADTELRQRYRVEWNVIYKRKITELKDAQGTDE
jgi:hypothetical protein